MNRQRLILILVGMAMMASGAWSLSYLRATERLGKPGIKTTPIPGKINVEIPLPRHVPGYKFKEHAPEEVVVTTLPKDTSLAEATYTAGDDFGISMSVVLMGMDRTSIHKPQFCLVGQGWHIDRSEVVNVPMSQPVPYELPVMKLSVSREVKYQGHRVPMKGIYLYWFVADHKLTAKHTERVWSMAKTLLTTGVLERWAYISCLAVCPPGQEDLTFERMKQFIEHAVPKVQLTPAPPTQQAAASVVQ